VQRITAREDAIFPVTIIGPPPSESSAIGASFIDFYLPLLRRQISQLVDIYMPQEAVFHGCALISVRVDEQLEQVKKQLHHCDLLRNSKLLIYVDEEIDVRQPQQVFWRIINQTAAEMIQLVGTTMVIDATVWTRQQRQILRPQLDVEEMVSRRWREYGFAGDGE